MKIGNIIDGLTVVDVKRVNKMNLIQFTKAVSEYIEQGYKLDVNSSRQVGLVLSVDLYKLESNLSGNVGTTGETLKEESSEDYKARLEKEGFSTNFVDGDNKEVEETKGSEPYNPENVVLKINGAEVEGFDIKEVDEVAVSDETEVEVSEAEKTTPPVKKTRAKKTT